MHAVFVRQIEPERCFPFCGDLLRSGGDSLRVGRRSKITAPGEACRGEKAQGQDCCFSHDASLADLLEIVDDAVIHALGDALRPQEEVSISDGAYC